MQAGDVLLYRPSGKFGWLIAVKTWNRISHVEVAVSASEAVASRDGQGVGRYPLRTAHLAHVLRPVQPFDLAAALAWYDAQPDQPYGWFDLLQFMGLNVNARGIVCSPFATQFLRAGGLDPFNGYEALKVAPFMFLTSPVFVNVTHEVTV